MNNARIRILSLAAFVMLAGTSMSVARAEDAPADAPLKGPEVKDRNVPGSRPAFGEGNEQGKREGRGGPMLFMRAVQSLNAPDAPDEVRASPEQIDEARGIMDEFKDAQRDFHDEHADEFKALRKQAGIKEGELRRGGGPGGPGDGKPGGPNAKGKNNSDEANADAGAKPRSKQDRKEARANLTPEQQEARQKLRALNEQGPKFEPYQARVWELLTEEQRTHVKATMDDMRNNMDEMGPPPPGGPGSPPPGDQPGGKQRGKGGKRKAPPAETDEMAPPPPADEAAPQ